MNVNLYSEFVCCKPRNYSSDNYDIIYQYYTSVWINILAIPPSFASVQSGYWIIWRDLNYLINFWYTKNRRHLPDTIENLVLQQTNSVFSSHNFSVVKQIFLLSLTDCMCYYPIYKHCIHAAFITLWRDKSSSSFKGTKFPFNVWTQGSNNSKNFSLLYIIMI